MPGNDELDGEPFDYRTLTVRQREVLRREIERRAALERAKALRAMFRLGWSASLRAATALRNVTHRCAARTAALVAGWWRAYECQRQRRADIAALHAFSDLELKDIGVRRAEISWVVDHGRELPGRRSGLDGASRPASPCAKLTPIPLPKRANEKPSIAA